MLALEGPRDSADVPGDRRRRLVLPPSGELLLWAAETSRTGGEHAGGKYELLRQSARRFWPESRGAPTGPRRNCMPLDRDPYIGRFSRLHADWYVATGFGKWGMTSSMAAALRISELARAERRPTARFFSPQRFDLPAIGKKPAGGRQAGGEGPLRASCSPAQGRELAAGGRGGVVGLGRGEGGRLPDETGSCSWFRSGAPTWAASWSGIPTKTWAAPATAPVSTIRGNSWTVPPRSTCPHTGGQEKPAPFDGASAFYGR